MKHPLALAALIAGCVALAPPAPAQTTHQHGHGQPAPSQHVHGAQQVDLTAAWSRPVMRDRPAAAYVTITNHGDAADRLLGARSPAFKTVEMHESRQENNMAMMYPVEAIGVPAHGTIELAPKGFHLMMFHAVERLNMGDSFPLILSFEKAGEVEVEVQVSDRPAAAGEHSGHGSHTGHSGN